MTLPFIWVQCDMGNGKYDLVDGQTGVIIFEQVNGWFCDTLFKHLDMQNEVYIRQFN